MSARLGAGAHVATDTTCKREWDTTPRQQKDNTGQLALPPRVDKAAIRRWPAVESDLCTNNQTFTVRGRWSWKSDGGVGQGGLARATPR